MRHAAQVVQRAVVRRAGLRLFEIGQGGIEFLAEDMRQTTSLVAKQFDPGNGLVEVDDGGIIIGKHEAR